MNTPPAKRILTLSLAALALAACSPDSIPVAPNAAFGNNSEKLSVGAGTVVIVSHDYDNGKGSLRDAIAQANAEPRIRQIEFKPQSRTVYLQSSIVYTGAQSLTIIGKNATLDAAQAGGAALIATGGANMTIQDLTVRNSIAEGIDIEIPSSATGIINVTLNNLTVMDNKGHGVLVNDQVQPETMDDIQPTADDRTHR